MFELKKIYVLREMMILFALIIVINSRTINQTMGAMGTSIFDAFLDPNSTSMLKSGLYIPSDVNWMRDDAIGFMFLFHGLVFTGPRDQYGIMRDGDSILFPYAIQHSLMSDTSNPLRNPSTWAVKEYGFIAITKTRIDMFGWYNYVSKSLPLQREIIPTRSIRESNDVLVITDVNDHYGNQGVSTTRYVYPPVCECITSASTIVI